MSEDAIKPLSWFCAHVADHSAATMAAYTGDVQQFLDWLTEHVVPFTHASRTDIIAYRNHLLERYAPASVARKLAVVRRFYSLAEQDGLVERNPAADVQPPLPIPRKRRVIQDDALLDAPSTATSKGIRDRAILALVVKHNLKTADIKLLDVSDVDLDADLIHVNGSVQALDTATAKRLKAWLVVRGLIRPASPALFVSLHWAGRWPSGERLSQRAVRSILSQYK